MIGKGSFARVYLVEDKSTKEKFAVKAFSKEYLLSQSKGKESLINEIEIMQVLRHDNIMTLEEIHESKNSIYLVLELLEGGELFSHISSKKCLSINSIHRIMSCLLKALKYLAEKGIMHRDLKPENMILKDKGKLEQSTLKIVDFGLSSFCDMEEYLFKRCGTPGYVAPEIINSSSRDNTKFDPVVDVFSAGIIFYILIVGRSPFDGKSFQKILNQNKVCDINFNNPKLKKYPRALELIKKMLEKSVSKRITAHESLQHDFFTSISTDDDTDKLDINFEDLKNINKKIQNDLNPENDSFVVRDHVINGETKTVNDADSKGGIFSLKGMKKQTKAPNDKRSSIYKYVLTKENN